MIYRLMLMLVATISLVTVVNVSDSTMLKPVALYLISALIVSVVLTRCWRKGELHVSFSTIDILFLSYILISTLSLTLASNHLLAVQNLGYVICYFIVLTAGENCLNDETKRRGVLKCFITVTSLCCLVAFAQNYNMLSMATILSSGDRLAISTFGNSTYFAGFLVMVIPLFLAEAVSASKKTSYRLFLSALILISIFMVIETQARSAWIALFISLILFGWMYIPTMRSRVIALGIIAVLGIAVAIAFPEILYKRLGGLFEMNPHSSLTRRLFFYEGAWRAFRSSPLIGNGIGNFIVFLPKFRSPEYWMFLSEDIVPHAHNEYLEILSETGLAGFTLFILILLSLFSGIKKKIKNHRDEHRLTLVGYCCSIIAVLTDNLGSMNLRTFPVAVGFWMLIGMTSSLIQQRSFSLSLIIPKTVRTIWPLPGLICGAFLVWYIPAVFSHYQADKNFLDGDLLEMRGAQEDATAVFGKSLSFDRYHVQSRFYLAANLIKANKFAEARDQLHQLLGEYPYYPKAHIMLGLCSLELGDTSTANREAEKELELETTPQTMYLASYFAFRLHQPEREYHLTLELLTNSAKSGIKDFAAEGITRLTPLCHKGSFQQECRPVLEKLVQRFPSELEILVAAAECYDQFDLRNEAVTVTTSALTLDQGDENLRIRLTRLAEKLGLVKQAEQ